MKVYSIHWNTWADTRNRNGVHPKQVSGTGATYYLPDEDGYCTCAMCQYYKWITGKRIEVEAQVPEELFEL